MCLLPVSLPRSHLIERMLDELKDEIARELDITVGADTPSRLNGLVGGTMTRRLVRFIQHELAITGENPAPYHWE